MSNGWCLGASLRRDETFPLKDLFPYFWWWVVYKWPQVNFWWFLRPPVDIRFTSHNVVIKPLTRPMSLFMNDPLDGDTYNRDPKSWNAIFVYFYRRNLYENKIPEIKTRFILIGQRDDGHSCASMNKEQFLLVVRITPLPSFCTWFSGVPFLSFRLL
jgi:hypothetical protein